MNLQRIAGTAIAAVVLCAGCGDESDHLKSADIYTQYRGVTFVEKFKVWATGPDEVIGRDALYEGNTYLYDGANVRLTALRGETEAFQLVINADYGNINDVRVSTTALTGPRGAVIPQENVTVFFEAFVKLRTPSDYRGKTGDVADPLVPLKAPFDLAKAESQPLFVVVTVQADAVPGQYSGKISVTAKGAGTETLILNVKVLNITLPREQLPPVIMEMDYRSIAR
jgi:hypothetical protein